MNRLVWVLFFFAFISIGLSPRLGFCAGIKMETDEQLSKQLAEDRIKTFEEGIIETGLSREDIPAINRPDYISVEDATLSNDDNDIVFIAKFTDDDVRIYPQLVLVWHEIVNDVVNGEKVSITYCPLTGSVVGYKGKVGLFNTAFGTTGMLVNNNLLMYDRSTNSRWPQLLGMAVRGPLRGAKLTTFPLLWTSFERAITRYPKAKVLSRTTGVRRSYGRDPYGSYATRGNYYDNNVIVHRLTYWDKRLHAKTRVLGMQYEVYNSVAVVKQAVEQAGVLNFTLGMTPIAAIYDADLAAVRVFEATANGKPLILEMFNGKVVDQQTKTEWTPEGEGRAGPFDGMKLKPLPAIDAMWFAWAAFFPDSEILQK